MTSLDSSPGGTSLLDSLQEFFTVQNSVTPLIKLNIAWIAVSVIVVSLRIYVRAAISRAIGWDDGFLLMSLAFFIALCGLSLDACVYSRSPEFVEVIKTLELYAADPTIASSYSPEVAAAFESRVLRDFGRLFKDTILINSMWSLSMCSIKVSLAFLYARFLQEKWQRITIQISTVAVVVTGIVCMFLWTFHCGPPTRSLASSLSGGCLPIKVSEDSQFVFAAFNVATDLTFTLLPILVLWKSNLPMSTRVSICVLFAMGLVSSAASVVKMYLIHSIFANDNDAVAAGMWTILEPGLAITAASLAVMRPLWNHLRGTDMATKLGVGSKTGSSNNSSGLTLKREVKRVDKYGFDAGAIVEEVGLQDVGGLTGKSRTSEEVLGRSLV